MKSSFSSKLLVLKYGVEKYLINNLKIFVPSLAGDYKIKCRETLNTTNKVLPLLKNLNKNYKNIRTIQAYQFNKKSNANKKALDLKKLFNKYCSDKSKYHNYELIY